MSRSIGSFGLLSAASVFLLGCMTTPAVSGEPTSPAVGYDIHLQAPHVMANGTLGGPFHHFNDVVADYAVAGLFPPHATKLVPNHGSHSQL